MVGVDGRPEGLAVHDPEEYGMLGGQVNVGFTSLTCGAVAVRDKSVIGGVAKW